MVINNFRKYLIKVLNYGPNDAEICKPRNSKSQNSGNSRFFLLIQILSFCYCLTSLCLVQCKFSSFNQIVLEVLGTTQVLLTLVKHVNLVTKFLSPDNSPLLNLTYIVFEFWKFSCLDFVHIERCTKFSYLYLTAILTIN